MKQKKIKTLDEAISVLGDRKIYELYERLVSLETTNLEDPKNECVIKNNYPAAAMAIKDFAESEGFSAFIYDPTTDDEIPVTWSDTFPRPNVIIDYNPEAKHRLMIIAHYDVVPVPKEQACRWTTPPNKLTFKDGLFYGRGSNDDIGSGVISSLQALRVLRNEGITDLGVRMVAACDEETGGAGGLESMMKKHRVQVGRGEPGLLDADLVFLPDASPHVIAGSSGIIFCDCVVEDATRMESFLDFVKGMKGFHEEEVKIQSRYDSADWPENNAPSPKITGRFTLTKFDWEGKNPGVSIRVHAETDSHNYIPGVVTVEIKGGVGHLKQWVEKLRSVHPIEILTFSHEQLTFQVIGKGGHGGSPHRAKNASELLIPVLEELMGVVPGLTGKGSIGFDMRLIPEGSAGEAYLRLERWFTAQKERHLPCARLISPEARRKQGYAIPLDDPDLGFLVGAVEAVTGERPKIVGEYGGTDASSFRDLVNREGKPLRALMYGSITSDSRPHDYDENADPLLIRRVTDIIVWMAKNWDKRRA